MGIKIPNDVYKILEKIEEAGFEAYIVGGAVRDFYLGIEPHDWDITTNATPEQVKNIFKKTIDTGLQHGTVTAMINGEGYEITTYRIDGEYEDNRRPSSVEFTTDLSKDLERRDITFNAMAMDKNGDIVDLFGGKKDLEEKIVRAVGDPETRIQEDALRMLRAVRFSAKYGCEIEESFKEAIKKNAHLIKNVSFERIEAEVTKILTSDHPEKFLDLYNLGLTKYIMPEFDEMMDCKQNTVWHKYTVGMHTMKAVEEIENDKILRWTMLLHDTGKPSYKTTDKNGQDHFYDHEIGSARIAETIMRRFKMPNKDIDEIKKLIFYHDIHMKKIHKIRRFVGQNGIDFIHKLIKIQYADLAAQSDYNYEEKINNVKKLEEDCYNVYKDKTAITLRDLKINGNDLMAIGFKGKEIGEILEELYEKALSSPEFNDRERLLNSARKACQKKHKNNTKEINDKHNNFDER